MGIIVKNAPTPPAPLRPRRRGGEIDLPYVLGAVRRRWLLLGTCIAAAAGAAVVYTKITPPAYQSSTSLRVETKLGALPEFYRPASNEEEIATELDMLRSRSLAEDVVDSLALQLRVTAPRGAARSALLGDIRIARTADTATLVLRTDSNGYVAVLRAGDSVPLHTVRPGARVRFPWGSFRVAKPLSASGDVTLEISRFADAVETFGQELSVNRTGNESKMIVVRYRGADPVLVSGALNALTSEYLRRRREARRVEARGSVAFLGAQIDTMQAELAQAELELREFRERQHVIDPKAEGAVQVNRLAGLQAERGGVEAERRALNSLLTSVRAAAAAAGPEDPSPYRRLIAFPTLLRNNATSELLRALTAAENERAILLQRRLPADPELQLLDERVRQQEDQLRTIATTYLEGLTNQVTAIDSTLAQFDTQLAAIPANEVEFARLQRQPKVLEEMVAVLQTRRKEAQIAYAAEDPSVQIVDPAVTPDRPYKPRLFLTLAMGLMVGTVLGGALVLIREAQDKAVHTRDDVQWALDAPVLALIPRLGDRRATVARLASWGQSPIDRHRRRRSAPARIGNVVTDSVGGEQAVAITAPDHAAVEAFARLQVNLAALETGARKQVLLFTSPLPGDGKTTTATNFALALARQGRRVVLVDGDLRRGTIGGMFGLPSAATGLADVASGQAPLQQALHRVDIGERVVMTCLPCGTYTTEPARVMGAGALPEAIAALRSEFDYIVIDSPPLNVVADAAVLSRHADGVVIVARAGRTAPEALAYTIEQLRSVHAPVLGSVLNDVDFRRDAAYDPSYRYYGVAYGA